MTSLIIFCSLQSRLVLRALTMSSWEASAAPAGNGNVPFPTTLLSRFLSSGLLASGD